MSAVRKPPADNDNGRVTGCAYCRESVLDRETCADCAQLLDDVLRLVRTVAAGLDQPRPVARKIMRLFFTERE